MLNKIATMLGHRGVRVFYRDFRMREFALSTTEVSSEAR